MAKAVTTIRLELDQIAWLEDRRARTGMEVSRQIRTMVSAMKMEDDRRATRRRDVLAEIAAAESLLETCGDNAIERAHHTEQIARLRIQLADIQPV
jgi:hypothetical protein